MKKLAAACFAGLVMGAAPAAAQEALLGIYGAWVLENDDCSKVFANDNGRVVFAAPSRGPLPAFIINPTSISNNEYLCSVREYRVRHADVNFSGRCEFGRRTRTIRFSMRELNGRYQIEMGRDFQPVKRCAPGDLKDLASVRADLERFARENRTAIEKATGFWASSAELCQRAFVRDDRGGYGISPALGANDLAVMISPRRFATRSSVCAPRGGAAGLQSPQEFQSDYICSAEGRDFQTTEKVVVIDQNTIERTPAARNPTPQRLVRCTPPEWERALAE